MNDEPLNRTEVAWTVFNYELDMFKELVALVLHTNHGQGRIRHNAFTESLCLHTRILCDIILSKKKKPSKKVDEDDIVLSDLIADVHLPGLSTLAHVYGNGNMEDSPCWIFNKKLAHPTTKRTDKFDYTTAIKALQPHLMTAAQIIINRKPRREQ